MSPFSKITFRENWARTFGQQHMMKELYIPRRYGRKMEDEDIAPNSYAGGQVGMGRKLRQYTIFHGIVYRHAFFPIAMDQL